MFPFQRSKCFEFHYQVGVLEPVDLSAQFPAWQGKPVISTKINMNTKTRGIGKNQSISSHGIYFIPNPLGSGFLGTRGNGEGKEIEGHFYYFYTSNSRVSFFHTYHKGEKSSETCNVVDG